MLPILYPECNKEGYHQGEKLNQVCLQKSCENDFLMCNICSTENHKNHNHKPIKIMLNDIYEKMQNNGGNIQNQSSIDQNDLINLIDMNKNKIMQNFKERVNSWILQTQKIENQLEKFFEQLKFGLKDQNNNLNDNQIQNILEQLQCSENSITEFQSKIQQLLDLQPQFVGKDGKEIPILQKQDLKQQLEKLFLSVDKQLIGNNSNIEVQLQKCEDQIENTIKDKIATKKIFYQQALEYLFTKHNNSTQLIVHEEGIEYETQGSTQLIYSEDSFQSGTHGYTMEMINFKEQTSSCFLIGVYEETDAIANKNTGNHPWACLFNGCRGKMTPDNKNFGTIIKKGDFIKVKLDIEANTFTISDGKDQLSYNLTPGSYSFKGKKLKFFISFYSSDCKVRLKIVESY